MRLLFRHNRYGFLIGTMLLFICIGGSMLYIYHIANSPFIPATTDHEQSAVKPKPLRTPFLWREDVLTIFIVAQERQLLTFDDQSLLIEFELDGLGIPVTRFADHSNVPFAMETIGDRRGLEGRLYEFRCWQQQHNPHAIRCEYLNYSDNAEDTQYGYNTWRSIPVKDKPTE